MRVPVGSSSNLNVRFIAVAALWVGVFVSGLAAQPADTASTTQPETGSPVDIHMTGNEETLWMTLGRMDPEVDDLVQAFAYLSRSSGKPRTARIRPQVGTFERVQAVGEGMHAFLRTGPNDADIIHQRYLPDGVYREVRLPGYTLPEALAEGTLDGRQVLMAIVPVATWQRVSEAWARERDRDAASDRRKGSRPDPKKETDASDEGELPDSDEAPQEDGFTPASSAEPGWAIAIYDGLRWRPGSQLPESCNDADRLVFCNSGSGIMHLFWATADDPLGWNHQALRDDTWTTPTEILLDHEPQTLLAAVINRQLVLTTVYRDEATEAFRVRTRIIRQGENTEASSAPQDLLLEQERVFETDALPQITPYGQHVAVMYVQQGEVLWGHWSPSTGEVTREPEPVVIRLVPMETPSERGFRDFAATLIVAALVLLLFWRRQESISQPIAMPPGVKLAGLGKRLLATLIDMLPALIISLLIWMGEILPFFTEVMQTARAADAVEPEAVPVPTAVVLWWVTLRGIYILHCIGFELITRSTPGKRLFGARVATESLQRPNTVQIIIRNVTRFLELEPSISPFLLVVFFTRNRQRIGDLLAQTIVVDGQHIPMADPIAIQEESSEGEVQQGTEKDGKDEQEDDSENSRSA